MIKRILGADWKLVALLSILSILFAAGISLMIFYTHDTATDDMQDAIYALQKKMDCPNNECDRFKGADALVLEARLMTEIAKVRQECQ
jgi:hypothetical protein